MWFWSGENNVRLWFTKCDGLQVDGMQEMAEQRPLETQHVPSQDLVTTTHGP